VSLPPPPDPTPAELPDGDVEAIEAALAAATPGRVATLLNGIQVAIWALCLAVTATGGLALGFGLWAAGSEPSLVAVVLVVAVPAIAIPLYVARRASALADAVTHPVEVLAQARDLATGLKDGPELRALVSQLRRRGRRAAGGAGRLRRALRSSRLVVAVIGLAGPDPVRHPLLVPFTPERLRRLWLAVLAGLWWWLAAAVLAVVALLAVTVRALV
jgi:hypothetical protein